LCRRAGSIPGISGGSKENFDEFERSTMNNLFRIFSTAALLTLVGVPAFSADSLSEGQKKDVEDVIQNYLLDHPEIITKAMEVLQTRKREAEGRESKAALTAQRSRLFDDPTSPVSGNPDGDITLIEFFDYRCGVCKRVHPIVDELMKGDPKIRRVYKEWPILGPDSVIAARAALASHKQGKYFAFHNALMEARSRLNRDVIMRIAKRVGIDTTQLARDMESPEIARILQENYALAQALKLNGTPSFVIEDTLLKGGRDLATMKNLVAAARAKK
jgi:protein-disulfide isomerase